MKDKNEGRNMKIQGSILAAALRNNEKREPKDIQIGETAISCEEKRFADTNVPSVDKKVNGHRSVTEREERENKTSRDRIVTAQMEDSD